MNRFFVIPAKAGIHEHQIRKVRARVGSIVTLDSRLRGNDGRI
jgi:hypothetical protein